MRTPAIRASLIFAAVLGVVTACGDDQSDASGGAGGDAGGVPGSGAGSGGEAGLGDALVPCLDRPNEALRPPAGRLPCDLLPPEFGR